MQTSYTRAIVIIHEFVTLSPVLAWTAKTFDYLSSTVYAHVTRQAAARVVVTMALVSATKEVRNGRTLRVYCTERYSLDTVGKGLIARHADVFSRSVVAGVMAEARVCIVTAHRLYACSRHSCGYIGYLAMRT